MVPALALVSGSTVWTMMFANLPACSKISGWPALLATGETSHPGVTLRAEADVPDGLSDSTRVRVVRSIAVDQLSHRKVGR